MFHQEVAKTGRETNGAERAHGKHSKARLGMEQAEEAYRSEHIKTSKIKSKNESNFYVSRTAVSSLEETRALWQKETESCMDTFQELEWSRLRVLRDSAWCLTNIGSASCVGDDQVEDNTQNIVY